MTYPAYPEYKDSGVEWLGEVPAHWEVKRLRYVAELNPSKSEVRSLPAKSYVSFIPMEAVGDDGSLSLDQTRPINEVLAGYTYVREGDVTIAKITPCFENGKGAVMRGLKNRVGFGTTELTVMRPKAELTTSNYLYRVVSSEPFRVLGESSMYGAGGQKRVPDEFVRNFTIAWPPFKEQAEIQNFLDHETARIDALVEEQQRLIELLKEKRQAVISHAVTKGLDPDVPMKDSGVEWLGEVPKHWPQVRLKHVVSQIIDTEHKTVHFHEDGEYLVVRTSNVRNGELILEGAKYTDAAGYKEWTSRGRPQPGDVLFTREAPAGEACFVPHDIDLCLGQRMVLFIVNKARVDSQFLIYSIYAGLSSEFIESLSQGSTVVHFNMSDIRNIPLFEPSLEEQESICGHLRTHLDCFDKLIEEASGSVELMKERRSALISAAVTGKIDVRGWKPPTDSVVSTEAKQMEAV
ncbi:restriction endonuclease subunit S [Halomonas alkaliantarctica]|nr:restriction endonuclease subunit S [Halomonas alkaliantarctica]